MKIPFAASSNSGMPSNLNGQGYEEEHEPERILTEEDRNAERAYLRALGTVDEVMHQEEDQDQDTEDRRYQGLPRHVQGEITTLLRRTGIERDLEQEPMPSTSQRYSGLDITYPEDSSEIVIPDPEDTGFMGYANFLRHPNIKPNKDGKVLILDEFPKVNEGRRRRRRSEKLPKYGDSVAPRRRRNGYRNGASNNFPPQDSRNITLDTLQEALYEVTHGTGQGMGQETTRETSQEVLPVAQNFSNGHPTEPLNNLQNGLFEGLSEELYNGVSNGLSEDLYNIHNGCPDAVPNGVPDKTHEEREPRPDWSRNVAMSSIMKIRAGDQAISKGASDDMHTSTHESRNVFNQKKDDDYFVPDQQ